MCIFWSHWCPSFQSGPSSTNPNPLNMISLCCLQLLMAHWACPAWLWATSLSTGCSELFSEQAWMEVSTLSLLPSRELQDHCINLDFNPALHSWSCTGKILNSTYPFQRIKKWCCFQKVPEAGRWRVPWQYLTIRVLNSSDFLFRGKTGSYRRFVHSRTSG